MRRLLVTAAATAVLVAACSDSDDSATAGDVTTTVSETVPATTLPPVTTPEFVPTASDGRPFVELTLEEKIEATIEKPNTIFLANIAGEMGLTGDPAWGPWLLDIFRIGSSSETSLAAFRALQDISGIPATGKDLVDFAEYGIWVRSSGVDPGPGYERFKIRLYEEGLHAQYGPLIDDVDDIEALVGISWGGVLRGGIPELNDNPRISVAEADFMTSDELVLGVVVEGIPVAYPVRFLARHELANDSIAGRPVSMVYCTLCRTGLMFDRNVEGRILTWETSGLLIDSNKIMVDVETDTLWHHLIGTGISGPLKGVELDQIPVQTTTWEAWIEEHPDTEVLDTPAPTFFPETPERAPLVYDYTPGTAQAQYYREGNPWFPILETPDIFAEQENMIAVEHNDQALALQLSALEARDGEPLAIEVGGDVLVVVPNPGGARVYSGAGTDVVAGAAPAVAPGGVAPDALTLADGTVLPRVLSSQTFWFAWYGLHADTLVWPEAS